MPSSCLAGCSIWPCQAAQGGGTLVGQRAWAGLGERQRAPCPVPFGSSQRTRPALRSPDRQSCSSRAGALTAVIVPATDLSVVKPCGTLDRPTVGVISAAFNMAQITLDRLGQLALEAHHQPSGVTSADPASMPNALDIVLVQPVLSVYGSNGWSLAPLQSF